MTMMPTPPAPNGIARHGTPRPLRLITRIGNVVLTMAAVAGTMCLLALVLALAFDVRIMLFGSGSMSPQIPEGSAALVRTVPATDVGVGDVVTVERSGLLPITHRIVSTEPVSGDPDARLLTLRGDANPTVDPAPYRVTEVGLVLVSVPGAAGAFTFLGSPWVMGAITLAASVLVVWAFWPRAADRREAPSGALVVGVALASAAAVLVPGAPARATGMDDATVVSGSVITLISSGDADRMLTLRPGDSVDWLVGVRTEHGTEGTIRLFLSGEGIAGLGLTVGVEACTRPWDGETCPGSWRVPTERVAPTDGDLHPLLSLPAEQERWLRLRVHLPLDTPPEATGWVRLRLTAEGAGDRVDTDGGALATTGSGFPWPLAGAAVVLLAAGVTAALGRRRRR